MDLMTKGKKHIVSRCCKCITNRLVFNGVSQAQICTTFSDCIASWIFEVEWLGVPFTFIAVMTLCFPMIKDEKKGCETVRSSPLLGVLGHERSKWRLGDKVKGSWVFKSFQPEILWDWGKKGGVWALWPRGRGLFCLPEMGRRSGWSWNALLSLCVFFLTHIWTFR